MKNLSIVLLLFAISPITAQFKFESGYFISNKGEKNSVLIKNRDWRYNPSEISYKISESSEVLTIKISDIEEFGIDQVSKYVRASVDVDLSGDKVSTYSKTRKPEFENKTVLLKILVEGGYSLYEYEESDLIRFFVKIKTETEAIQPLIYKKYIQGEAIDGAQIKTNRSFLQVLSRVACDNVTDDDLLQINYKSRDLSEFMVESNICNNSEVVELSTGGSGKSSLSVVLGGYSSSLSGSIGGGVFDFGNVFVPSLGFQYELAMPYGGGKWSVIVEPTFLIFSADGERNSSSFNGGSSQKAELDYRSLDVAVGPRFNYYLDADKKIFFNLLGVYHTSLGSIIDFETAEDLELGTGLNLGIGGGFVTNKLSAEIRFYTNRNLMNKYLGGENENPRIGLNIGYRIYQ